MSTSLKYVCDAVSNVAEAMVAMFVMQKNVFELFIQILVVLKMTLFRDSRLVT